MTPFPEAATNHRGILRMCWLNFVIPFSLSMTVQGHAAITCGYLCTDIVNRKQKDYRNLYPRNLCWMFSSALSSFHNYRLIDSNCCFPSTPVLLRDTRSGVAVR